MKGVGMGSWGLVCLFAAGSLSCAAQSAPRLLGQPVKKELAVLVRVSDDVAETDDLGGTAGVVDGVTASLGERSVQNQVFAANDDHPPAPRIEIWVERWDTGDRPERAAATASTEVAGAMAAATPGVGLVYALVAAGGYSVLCKIYTKDAAAPACVQRYSGLIVGTDAETSAKLGERVGRAIVADAFDVAAAD